MALYYLISQDDRIKVMDFGIAKQSLTPGVTLAGTVAGTPAYMSPEQFNNFAAVSHLTDLYSLGVVAFQLFTGRTPFESNELMPLLMMHVNQPPPSPRSLNANVPVRLDAIILKLLEKNPQNRFGSCAALAQALRFVASEA